MGTRMFPGSGEKLRAPSGPTRQDLGSSSSSRDRRDRVPVMVDGLQVLTSLNRTGDRSGKESKALRKRPWDALARVWVGTKLQSLGSEGN